MHTEPYIALRTNCVPKNYTYTVKFDRDITAPELWQEELDTLRMAKEGDDVILHVSTMGGNAATMAEVLHIIKHSPAHFHCVLAGTAFSAGGPIMLACDTVEVGDYAEMMIHTSQNSYYSSSQGLEQFSAMNGRTARKILSTCYEGFMTQGEINQALDGKEFWFDSDEIKERLIKREEYYSEKYPAPIELELTKEDMESMSKDEIIRAIFGDDEDESYGFEDTSFGTYELDVDEILTTDKIDYLRKIADDFNIKYVHNIGIEKLRDKLVDYFTDGVDSK